MRRKIQGIGLMVAVGMMLFHVTFGISLSIAIVGVTLIGGRFFCRYVCPLGTLQDVSSYLGEKGNCPQADLHGKSEKLLYMKYPVLIGVSLLFLSGQGIWISRISPFQAFFNIPRLSAFFSTHWPGVVLLVLLCVVGMVIPRGFCRILCPVGAFLVLSGAVSSYRDQPTLKCEPYECVGCCSCKNVKTQTVLFGRVRKETHYVMVMVTLFIGLLLLIPVVGSVIQGTPLHYGVHSYQSQESSRVLPYCADGNYVGTGEGYKGAIVVEVTIKNHEIRNIQVLSHRESAGWYEPVFERVPERIIEGQNNEVEAIAGATRTSDGVMEAVGNALEKAG
ncbi:MAG: FMN-binding protein, partial [Anaerovorax sp.]